MHFQSVNSGGAFSILVMLIGLSHQSVDSWLYLKLTALSVQQLVYKLSLVLQSNLRGITR